MLAILALFAGALSPSDSESLEEEEEEEDDDDELLEEDDKALRPRFFPAIFPALTTAARPTAARPGGSSDDAPCALSSFAMAFAAFRRPCCWRNAWTSPCSCDSAMV